MFADLAQAGVKLAQVPHVPDEHGPPAQQAFAALREAGVIDGELCRQLTRAQNARSMIEHSCIQTPAGNVHRAAELVRASALDFIGRYREWVEPQLEDSASQSL